ncbi:MAG: glycoside hydrolase family 9 protein [Butyrivibrio sp.]|uniref:glycoside hydrolase family 9 protein n=1 Tax=Butyrivibrio sp. TaxID=28121 RepID=UPI001B17D10E|nr:glycoside hydrolase family 9 protein [Butyrivibrio sp.]MBO6240089.1 glycoside hydrolase family 9 protein [Butyrivibrio sp.]
MFSYMRGKKKIAAAVLLAAVLGSAAGCGASSSDNALVEKEKKTAKFDYEAPVQTPNILVDQTGFLPDSDKVVIFRGKELPETFTVCRLEDGESCYEGEVLKKSFDQELGVNFAVGYFTDLTEEGDYYIYADHLGESYSFSVSQTTISDLFNEACKKFYYNRCGIALSESYAGDNTHSACHTSAARLQEDDSIQLDVTGGWHMDEQADRDTNVGSKIAENFLLAYEMDEEVFTDDIGIPESGNGIPDILDEVRYEVEWLLKMQDEKTGGEYGAAITDSSKGGDIFTYPVVVTPVSMEATINFAAMMARFSYFYQQYDPEFATVCLRAADKAWNCYLMNQNIEDSAVFKAAAQLYRATGNQDYEAVLNSFFLRKDFEELFKTDENVFIGAVTYLSTSQAVDVDQCGKLMKMLMKKSEKIAEVSTKSQFLVTDITAEQDFSKLLYDMRCLTITDHIIYNHEYTTIIENHLHFLMGMNPGAMNYVTDSTERTYRDDDSKTGILNDPGNDALLIFMLSVLR